MADSPTDNESTAAGARADVRQAPDHGRWITSPGHGNPSPPGRLASAHALTRQVVAIRSMGHGGAADMGRRPSGPHAGAPARLRSSTARRCARAPSSMESGCRRLEAGARRTGARARFSGATAQLSGATVRLVGATAAVGVPTSLRTGTTAFPVVERHRLAPGLHRLAAASHGWAA